MVGISNIMNDIEEIKSRIDIVSYIGKYVTLKKSGQNYKGLCPLHGEKTPSFMVSPERQAFHCFGCGKGGSIFDFMMEYDHVDFREALYELADQAGVTLTRQDTSASPQDALREKLLEVHHVAREYFQYLLLSHSVGKNALEYLKTRGVKDKTIETFGIGYSANSWDGLRKYLHKKGYDDQVLEASGLIITSNRGGYDRFRGRVMFPLNNHRKQTVGFSGRLLNPDAKEVKYINSPETTIYKKGQMVYALDVTKAAIQKAEQIVVVEGEFDVISSFQAGVGNIVAIKGTALTHEQVALLKRFANKIVFALDGDVAGDAAGLRGIDIAERVGFEIYVAQMPDGKDPDDLATHEPHILKKAIKDALSIYDYFFATAISRHDASQAYGKKQIADALYPVIARIDNPIVEAHYIKKLAALVAVSEQTVVETLRKVKRQQAVSSGPVQSQESSSQESHENKHELYLLALLLQGKPSLLLPTIELVSLLASIQTPVVREIVARIGQEVASSTYEKTRFLSRQPEEWRRILDQAIIWDLGQVASSDELLLPEWKTTCRNQLVRYYRQQIEEITKQLKSREDEESDELSQKLSELASKLLLLEKER